MVQDVFQLGQAIGVMIVLMQSAAAVLIRSRQVLREALFGGRNRGGRSPGPVGGRRCPREGPCIGGST